MKNLQVTCNICNLENTYYRIITKHSTSPKNLQKVELYTFALLLFSILFIEVVWCSFRFQNALNLLLCSLLGERCKQTCIGISAYILGDELYLFFGKEHAILLYKILLSFLLSVFPLDL